MRVTWDNEMKNGKRSRSDEVGYSEYLNVLENHDYSILLIDGGVIQMLLDYVGSKLMGYRYAYIPCPIYFSERELEYREEENLTFFEFIGEFGQRDLINRFRIRPTFRFEYDPDTANEDYPSCHVHLSKSSSKIPVSRPVAYEQFLRFIFKNFYPEFFASYSEINGLSSRTLPEVITVEHKRELHFHVDTRI